MREEPEQLEALDVLLTPMDTATRYTVSYLFHATKFRSSA